MEKSSRRVRAGRGRLPCVYTSEDQESGPSRRKAIAPRTPLAPGTNDLRSYLSVTTNFQISQAVMLQ